GFAITVLPDAPFTQRQLVSFLESRKISTRRFFGGNLTRHPDFLDLLCDLQGATVTADPSMTTLRLDQTWAPQGRGRPRGTVYAVAVLLSVRKDGQAIGQQTGSERIVVLDGSAYGFMPCLR
ncbi:hypothetical protein ACFQ1S_37455, partial [Kibdelosporangium lantanae]